MGVCDGQVCVRGGCVCDGWECVTVRGGCVMGSSVHVGWWVCVCVVSGCDCECLVMMGVSGCVECR